MSEKKLKEVKKKKIELEQLKEYIPFSERIESSKDEQTSMFEGKDKDDMEGLYKTINETRKEVMDYPSTNNNLLMMESLLEHDLVFKDLFNTLFVKQKHVGNNASIQGFNFLNNSVKALAINESEKRISISKIFGKKK